MLLWLHWWLLILAAAFVTMAAAVADALTYKVADSVSAVAAVVVAAVLI
jgi:hypothetical protein